MENCIRYDGKAERGFVVDRGDYSVEEQARWASGDPDNSFWRGVVQQRERKLAVVTYRCTSCGRLESFAPESATK